jgi:hypothetical protein
MGGRCDSGSLAGVLGAYWEMGKGLLAAVKALRWRADWPQRQLDHRPSGAELRLPFSTMLFAIAG